ncbi:MAG: N-acetylmuramoyl-L-alanine amidase [Bryobacteraceae bacterium]|nr:N-acetylmuramoyl-L-alanine amidase [Bryobacteraceae bacterium]
MRRIIRRWAVGAILLLCGLSAQAAEPLAVTAVRFWSLADVTRIAVETNGPFAYESQRIDRPDRMFYDLIGAKHQIGDGSTYVIAVDDGRVKQIRVAENQPSVTRVVLDLTGSTLLIETSRLSLPDRLMIEVRERNPSGLGTSRHTSNSGVTRLKETAVRPVSPTAPPRPAEVTEEIEPPASRPAVRAFRFRGWSPVAVASSNQLLLPAPPLFYRKPLVRSHPVLQMASASTLPPPPGKYLIRRYSEAPAQPEPTVVEDDESEFEPAVAARVEKSAQPTRAQEEGLPRAARTNSNGDRSLTRVLGLKVRRVVIDPGHGGQDHGTTGPGGLTEKALVLDVAKRLGGLVEERMGSEVIYTRTSDSYVPLETRPQLANARKADLFISIHANSSPARSAAGVETYYLSFTTSKAALEVAARENASSERSIHELRDVLQKIALRDKLDESREFAAKVQKSLSAVSTAPAPARNRGIKRAPFVVLIGAQMPAVLVEIGFVSNSREEQMMKKPDYRQKLAEALYQGVSQYADTLSHFDVAQRRSAGSE